MRGKRRVRTVKLGSKRFRYPARRRKAVIRVKVTRRGVRLLRTKRRHRVVARASVRFGDGTSGRPSRKLWLYRPSARRR